MGSLRGLEHDLQQTVTPVAATTGNKNDELFPGQRKAAQRTYEALQEERAPATAEYWAARINAHGAKGLEVVVAIGNEFLAAKKSLQHGEWTRMFDGKDPHVAKPVPFKRGQATRYMRIAEFHSKRAGTPVFGLLPGSQDVLYEMTKVPDSVLDDYVAAGKVHAGMTKADVQCMRTHPNPNHPNLTMVAASVEALPPTVSPAVSKPKKDVQPKSTSSWKRTTYAIARDEGSREAKQLYVEMFRGWLAELRLLRRGIDSFPLWGQRQSLVKTFCSANERGQNDLVHMVESVIAQLEQDLGAKDISELRARQAIDK